MTDTPTSDEGIGRQARNNFAIAGLLFCAVDVIWCTVWGNPANSLHTSAQAWGFGIAVGILAGLGFGAVAHMIPGFKK